MKNKLKMPVPDSIIDNDKLYARIYGEGEPVLMIHGNCGSGFTFSKIIAPLTDTGKYKLIIIDLPHHGSCRNKTPGFADNPTLAVQYCVHILKELSIISCHICGHSLGGMIGLLLCIQHSGYVKSLALMDNYVKIPERPAELSNWIYPGNERLYKAEVDDAFDDGPGVRWISGFDVAGSVNKITCPVLELQAESMPGTEKIFANWTAEKRAGFPANWEIKRVPRSGHFIQIEQPQATIDLLDKFWRKIYNCKQSMDFKNPIKK